MLSVQRRVRLEVWGFTDRDRVEAIADARTDPRLHRYRIDEVEPADFPAASSAGLRGNAVASRADYGRTWTAYLLPDGAPGREAA